MRTKSPSLPPLTSALPIGRPPTVADYVADCLRQSIVDGRLSAGAELRQEEIAERLNVSRMPVREALKRLEVEGWVDVIPRRGAVVASFDAADIREAFALRTTLESDALRRSIPLLNADDFDEAQQLLDDLDDTDDPVRYANLHKEFHLVLTAKAGRRYRNLIAELLDATERYLRMEIGSLANHAESQAEHHALLVACRRKDIDAAISLLTPHITEAGADLARLIEARLPETQQ